MDGALIVHAPGLRIEGRISHAIPLTDDHAQDPRYVGWLHDREIVRTLNLPKYMAAPVAKSELLAYCRDLAASEHDLYLALCHTADDAFVGTLKAGHMDFHAGTADIGIMIGDKRYWGKGIATDSIHALCRHLFSEIGLRRATAGAMEINPAMIAVFEKLGFRREGCLRSQDRLEDGSFCDHVLLGCLAAELRDPEAA